MPNREDLNKVTHSVRAAQAILQYGVGAMVEFPDQTLVTAAPELWSKTLPIHDERFAKALGVDHFAMPTKISYVRFPEWYFCPQCRRFQPLEKWIEEYNRLPNIRDDQHMVRHMRCPECKVALVVTRIVTVCKDGHLNDFPWVDWVHAKSGKEVCNNPQLKYNINPSGAEDLGSISITCSCGASATLKGALESDYFKKLEDECNGFSFLCGGNHPFRHTKEKCPNYPQAVLRGASSVYFPLVYSSLVIPPYADKLNSKIEQSRTFNLYVTVIRGMPNEDERIQYTHKLLQQCAQQVAVEIGASEQDVRQVLARKWLEDSHAQRVDATSIQYRMEEYSALTGEIGASESSGVGGDFSREETDIAQYNIPHIKAISLINKIRVVNALRGFSRLRPRKARDSGFVEIKKPGENWYPAYEVRGEGIFIEFNQDEIDAWVNDNPQVSARLEPLVDKYESSIFSQRHPSGITPKFVMLHTLSHLLISQLSFECGYSVASLSERLYCAEKSDGRAMAGIFIYTASGDSEGTLGGLVRQGRSDTFPRILRKAVANAKTCSNDPVCIMSRGQGNDSLNLAACHACALLPETCCEERNVLLDRGVIVGTYDDPKIGFWSDIL